MFIKVFVTAFVLFAMSRVWLRYRDGAIGMFGTGLWSFLWVGVGVFVWWPKVSDYFAQTIGIGRGVDALVYISIVGLFYGMFRLYVKLEFLEHELTSLVRTMALNAGQRKDSHQPHP